MNTALDLFKPVSKHPSITTLRPASFDHPLQSLWQTPKSHSNRQHIHKGSDNGLRSSRRPHPRRCTRTLPLPKNNLNNLNPLPKPTSTPPPPRHRRRRNRRPLPSPRPTQTLPHLRPDLRSSPQVQRDRRRHRRGQKRPASPRAARSRSVCRLQEASDRGPVPDL